MCGDGDPATGVDISNVPHYAERGKPYRLVLLD